MIFFIPKPLPIQTSSPNLIVIGIAFVILLSCYIASLVLSKRSKMVLSSNGWDMAMVLICPVALLIASCWNFKTPFSSRIRGLPVL